MQDNNNNPQFEEELDNSLEQDDASYEEVDGTEPESEDVSEDDAEIEVYLEGQRQVLTTSDIVGLIEKQKKYETVSAEVARLKEYENLANFVVGDELANRVTLYRMQGNSPAEIVLFLYQHFTENGMIDPYTGEITDKGRQQAELPGQQRDEVQNLKSEVEQLRGYIASQAVVNQNTSTLSEVFSELGFEAEPDQETIALMQEVSKELFGDEYFLLRRPASKQQVRIIVREMKERLGKKPAQRQQPMKKVVVRSRSLPSHFPAKTKASGSSGSAKNLPKEYSIKNAELAYKTLLGD